MNWVSPHRARPVRSCVAIAAATLCGASVASAMPLPVPDRDAETTHDRILDDHVNFAAMDRDREVMFNIRAGFEHQFKSNIDDGGSFRSSRIGSSLTAMSAVTEDFSVRFAIGYEFDYYDFSGNTEASLGSSDPWQDIHTIGFGAIFTSHLTNEWTLFGGPVFQFSAESGADFSDGFIGGGVIGTSYRFGPDLTLGGGLGITTQIERSARFFPVVLVDWDITDQLKLTSRTATQATGDTGVELVYDWGGGLETAVGGTYRFRRFRLDDGGNFPDGVGQHQSFPVWARITYHFSPSFSMNLYGGVVAAGSLRLMDENGNTAGKQDYDPAGLIGISGSIRF